MTSSRYTRFAWLGKHFRDHPLLVLWSLVLCSGGAVLLYYHVELAYLPDFNLVDLAGLMASVTLIGLLFVVFFVLSCILPGLAVRWLEDRWPLIPYRRYFTIDRLVFLWLYSAAIWAMYMMGAEFFRSLLPTALSPVLLFAMIVLASLFAAVVMSSPRSAIFSPRCWKDRLMSRHVVAFTLWITLFLFPIQSAFRIAASGNPDWEFPTALGIIALLTVFNGAFYTASFNEIRDSLGIHEAVAFGLVVFGFGLAIAFPQSIMQSLALGHRNAVTLTVAGKNCHSLARFGIQCTPEETKDGVIELENVNVLSRVGTTVLLELLVRQGEDGNMASSGRGGTLVLDQALRQRYCPSSATDKACTRCDPSLLRRARSSGKEDAAGYRNSLVCVPITVSRNDILNISFGDGRRYDGYSGFALPALSERRDRPASTPP